MIMNPGVEDSELTRRVKRVIARYLPHGEDPCDIPDQEALAVLGIDSMRSIDLLLQLESTFGVTFPDESITAENFSTAANIARTLSATLDSSRTAGV